jgi:hypothetical protein
MLTMRAGGGDSTGVGPCCDVCSRAREGGRRRSERELEPYVTSVTEKLYQSTAFEFDCFEASVEMHHIGTVPFMNRNHRKDTEPSPCSSAGGNDQ